MAAINIHKHGFLLVPTMRPELKPLARYPVVALVSCGLLFAAFLLLLLVALSLPIIKTIFLVRLTSESVQSSLLSIANELRFGVWGLCATSSLYKPTNNNAGLCFGPKLGYDIPDYFATALRISPQIIQAVQKGLIAILILHPIAAGFATLSFLTSLFLASHAFSIFSLILTIITALLTSILLAIDIALVVVADSKVKNLDGLRVKVSFGNGVWMILVAVVFSWAAVITLSARACYCMGVRRHPEDDSRIRKRSRQNDQYPMTNNNR